MRRVAVTGVGIVSPIGTGVRPFWWNLLDGVSGARPVTSFSTDGLRNRIGCEILDFSPDPLDAPQAGHVGRASRLAEKAAALALEDAGLDARCEPLGNAGVAMGTTMGEAQQLERPRSDGAAGPPSRAVPRIACEAISLHVAAAFGLGGPIAMFTTACAAGNYACGYAFDMIRHGRADLMLAGGADAFSRVAFLGFSRLLVMSTDVCRPFDRNRKGMLLGEGAGVLVLEEMTRARARGVPIYAEVLGYAVSCDAHHMTAPRPDGQGAAMAMARALENSGVAPQDVDYISAHGTGTPTNDRTETLAIRRVFGEHAYRLAISSVKAVLGHSMGAASAIEAGVCALAIARSVIPPTWNLQDADPECDLDYVPGCPRSGAVGVALNNAYGFGGNNACVVFGHVAR